MSIGEASQMLRGLRRKLGSAVPMPGSPFGRIGVAFGRAQLVVKFYYLASIYFACATIVDIHETARQTPSWDFLWPVQWLAGAPVEIVIDCLALLWLLASLLCLQFDRWYFRALFAVAVLQVGAVSNSFGGMNHAYHAWFWIGFCLIFLPDAADRTGLRAARMGYLMVIATCQALLLSFYSLAGLWKILGGFVAFSMGREGNFSPNGLSLTLADRILQTGTSPLLGRVVIDHTWLSQPMFLILIYIQFVAVAAAFRPRLHVSWGYLIIAFHIGTWLLMEILFIQHVVLLALFLVLSPFAPKTLNLREIAADLPVLGRFARRLLPPSKKPLPQRQSPEVPA